MFNDKTQTASSRIWLAILLVAHLWVFVPWSPYVLPGNLATLGVDYSGFAGVFDAVARGRQWGIDIAFPYGPSAFLMYNFYYPGLYETLLGTRILLAVISGMASWRLLLWAMEKQNWSIWPLGLLLLCIGIWYLGGPTDIRFTIYYAFLLLSFFILDDGPRPSLTTLLLAVAIGIAAPLKFYFFALFLSVSCAIGFVEIVIRRQIPVVFLVATASFLAAWLAAGQSFGNILPWFSSSLDAASNFGFAQVLGYDEPGLLLQAGYMVLASLAVAGIVMLATWQRRHWFEAVAAMLTIGLICFMNFKHGTTRHDAHAGYAATAFTVLLMVAILLLIRTSLSPLRKLLATILLILLALGNLQTIAAWKMPTLTIGTVTTALANGTSRIADMVRRKDGELEARFQAMKTEITRQAKLPPLNGSVDSFPDFAAIPILTGQNYQPRPEFQTFSVFNEAQTQRNLRYYQSGKSADFILYRSLVTDWRYALADEPLSWLELLTRYKISELQSPEFTILEKAKQPGSYSLTPLGQTATTWGQPLGTGDPGGNLLWAAFDIKLSLLGRIASILYKVPPTMMTLELADGRKISHRVVSPLARQGFLLSPYVETVADLHALTSPDYAPVRAMSAVKSVTFTVEPNYTVFYADTIGVTFSKLDLAGPADRSNALVGEPRRLFELKQLRAATSQSNLYVRLLAEDGRQVLLAHAPTQIERRVPAGSRAVEVTFGIRREVWTATPPGDGVTFSLIGIAADGSRRPLFTKHVAPSQNPADRIMHVAKVALPDGCCERIVFDTGFGPAGNGSYDHSYWADVQWLTTP
ncbi:hypothetical protein [Ferrovibrio sp.]|uniref:hypothetical protein n=1 Tax=Ferrovibrio sp. TaxID=1917215 RepID=UPI003D0F8487